MHPIFYVKFKTLLIKQNKFYKNHKHQRHQTTNHSKTRFYNFCF